MGVLVPVVAGAMAGALLWAGLEKARRPRAFAALLSQLGVPDRAARSVALLVIALELGVGAGLTLGPSGAALAGVVLLASGFAGAGFLALWGNRRLQCGCFGPYGGGRLGSNQLLALPLWLGGVAFLWSSAATLAAGAGRALLPAAVALTIAAIRLAGTVRAAHAAKGDRRSAREMLLWLSR